MTKRQKVKATEKAVVIDHSKLAEALRLIAQVTAYRYAPLAKLRGK